MPSIPCPKCSNPIEKTFGAGAVVVCSGCGARFKTRSSSAGAPPAQESDAAPRVAPKIAPKIAPRASTPEPAAALKPEPIAPRIAPAGGSPSKIQPQSTPPAVSSSSATSRARTTGAPAKSKTPLYIGAGVLAAVAVIAIIAMNSGGGPTGGGNQDSGANGPSGSSPAVAKDPYDSLMAEVRSPNTPVQKLKDLAALAQSRKESAEAAKDEAAVSRFARDQKWVFEQILKLSPDDDAANLGLGHVKFDLDEAQRLAATPGLESSIQDDFGLFIEDMESRLKGGRRVAWLKPGGKDKFAAKWSELQATAIGIQAASRARSSDPWYEKAELDGNRRAAALSNLRLVDFRVDGNKEAPFHVEAHKPYVFLIQKSSIGFEERAAARMSGALQDLLKTFWAYFGETAGLKLMDGPAFIVLLKNDGEYAKYLRKDDISAPVRSGGHFEPWSNQIVIYRREEASEREVLFHEGTHQIVEWAMRAAPGSGSRQALWFSEGIAEYFGGHSVEFKDGQKSYVPGLLNLESVTTFGSAKERGDMLPLRELLSYSRDDYNKQRNDPMLGRRVGNAYAQGWALCYYLQEYAKEKYREKFAQYSKGEFEGKSGLSHFTRIFGESEVAAIEAGYVQMLVDIQAAVKDGRVINGRLVK